VQHNGAPGRGHHLQNNRSMHQPSEAHGAHGARSSYALYMQASNEQACNYNMITPAMISLSSAVPTSSNQPDPNYYHQDMPQVVSALSCTADCLVCRVLACTRACTLP
jgi:hypothetical protein